LMYNFSIARVSGQVQGSSDLRRRRIDRVDMAASDVGWMVSSLSGRPRSANRAWRGGRWPLRRAPLGLQRRRQPHGCVACHSARRAGGLPFATPTGRHRAGELIILLQRLKISPLAMGHHSRTREDAAPWLVRCDLAAADAPSRPGHCCVQKHRLMAAAPAVSWRGRRRMTFTRRHVVAPFSL